MLRISSLLLPLLLCSSACGTKKEAKAPAESSPAKEATSQGEAPAAKDNAPSNLFGGTSAMAVGAMLAQAQEPGIYDDPKQSDNYKANESYIGTLDLEGNLVEMKGVSLFGGMEGVPLRKLQERLTSLRQDEHLKGLLLRVDDLTMSTAMAQALRRSLVHFKEDGKRTLYCHTESAANLSYYLLSACDSIAIAPSGQIIVSGVAVMPVHLKGLLDKLGIKADFLHVGDYKGAAEPLTLDKPSKAMQETLAAILDSGYETLVNGIAQGRKLSPDAVRTLIDTAMFHSKEAIAAKLVDAEATYEDYRANLGDDLPYKRLTLSESKPSLSNFMDMLGLKPRVRTSADHIALVYALGNIIDGDGEGILGARNEIASHTLAAALRRLGEADSVKAIVLRVDSGGGSALASELIWHAVNEAKAKKPVVVSMGSVAASGGYYISSGATRIFAEGDTLTGSIGVVGGKLALAGAFNKIGIKSFPQGRGKRSLMWASMAPWDADEHAAIQKSMENVYNIFVGRVAQGRNKTRDEIHAIAQGRVWTGKDALKNGLVDEIGGLKEALAHAQKLSDTTLDDLEVYPPEPSLMDFVHSLAGGGGLPGQAQLLSELEALAGREVATVVGKSLSQLRSFQQSTIQTALILPVIWK